jgi:hypothetical protein
VLSADRAGFVNARGRWRGRLQGGRHASGVMDEDHLIAASRHVALNPVLDRAPDFAALIRTDPDDPAFAAIRSAAPSPDGRRGREPQVPPAAQPCPPL